MPPEIRNLDEARKDPAVASKRAERIRPILRAAMEVARVEGREAVTLTRVAQRMGLSTAALHRHFSSKDALVAELQRAVITVLATTTRACVDRADAYSREIDLPDGERALLGVTVSALVFEAFSRTAPVEFGILSMNLSMPEVQLPDREAAHVFEAAWSSLRDLAEQLEAAEACGVLEKGDASERSIALWAGLQGVVQTRKLSRNAPELIDSTRIAHGLVTALLVGWGAEAETARRLVELTRARGFAALPDSTHEGLEELAD